MKSKIAVLAGGPSCEREISLISGEAVAQALRQKGFETFLIDPDKNLTDVIRAGGAAMVFNALHGTYGEDGTVQEILDKAGIPYTGCGASTSRLAFDKSKAQKLFQSRGLTVPEFEVLYSREDILRPSALGFPVVVKPAKAGSSVGVSLVGSAGQYAGACLEAFRYSDRVITECYIRGRELTVSVLGNKTLPVVEVMVKRPFYDYKAKYRNCGTRYQVPAVLPPKEERAVREAARRACRLLKVTVMGRVDIILDRAGRPFVLEVNTIPGLTGKSLLPKAAKAAGIDFSSLCVKIMALSLSTGAGRRAGVLFKKKLRRFDDEK